MGEGSFELVAERVPEDAAEEINCEPTIVGMVSTFEKAWRCLEEESVGIIGLYVNGGVGKYLLKSTTSSLIVQIILMLRSG